MTTKLTQIDARARHGTTNMCDPGPRGKLWTLSHGLRLTNDLDLSTTLELLDLYQMVLEASMQETYRW